MKIILNKDVPGVGRRYDIKNVSEGYATNFLLPKKLAIAATEKEIQRLNIEKLKNEQEVKIQHELLEKNLADLKGKTVTLKAKAGESGSLFKGIHKEEISKAIKEELRLDIPENLINLEHPIKNLGSHKVMANDSEFEVVVETES